MSQVFALEDSIERTIGLLYQRRAAAAELIRVLEEYGRFSERVMTSAGCVTNRQSIDETSITSPDDAACSRSLMAAFHQELQRLYVRRAAINEVIVSIENYHRCQATHSPGGESISSKPVDLRFELGVSDFSDHA